MRCWTSGLVRYDTSVNCIWRMELKSKSDELILSEYFWALWLANILEGGQTLASPLLFHFGQLHTLEVQTSLKIALDTMRMFESASQTHVVWKACSFQTWESLGLEMSTQKQGQSSNCTGLKIQAQSLIDTSSRMSYCVTKRFRKHGRLPSAVFKYVKFTQC